MEQAPGLAQVIRQWSIDPVWIGLGGFVLAAYLRALLGTRDAKPHPRSRVALFTAGVLLVVVPICSPIEHYSRQLLWVDFTGFLVLTMMAPPLILLGSPLTLAFRASSERGRRRWRALYRCRAVAILTFPVATWLTFAVVTYVWQFTELTEIAAKNALVRDLQQLSLLAAGLLFWSPALAADPMRWRLNWPLRTLYVLVEMTHKGLFGGMFLSMNNAIHSGFAANAPAWAPSPMTDQRIAILILWIGGNLVFVGALAGLVIGWIRFEQRNAHRTDYRLMLEREARRKRRAALDKVFERPV